MRRRRRPVPWAAMKFLMEAYRRQRRRMNLEQILLLASRCALVALLALALAKPVLGAVGLLSQGPRLLYVLIDNGLTSSATVPGDTAPELDSSRAMALDLISRLDQSRGDRVGVISLAGPAEGLVLPPTPDLAASAELIRQLRPTESRSDLPGGLLKVRDELLRTPPRPGEGLVLALVSGFRAGSTDLETSLASLAQASGQGSGGEGSGIRLLLESPAQTRLDNICITSVEPAHSVLISSAEPGAPGASSELVRISLRRSGPGVQSAGITKVFLEAVMVSPNTAASAATPPGTKATRVEGVCRWAPGQETAMAPLTVEIPARPQGSHEPVVLLASIDRDAVAGDNTFRRPIDTRDRLEVALLAPGTVGSKGAIDSFSPADWLAIALAPEADLLRRRQGGVVRVTPLDPERTLIPSAASHSPAGLLSEYDAVLIPRPDLVDSAGWRMVRAAADLGALILISPPEAAQTHLWSDAMCEGLGLDWTISREARALTPPLTLASERPTPSGPDLLEVLATELPQLVKPVTVSRALTIQGPPGSFEPLLRLSDGSPLLVMGQAGSRAGSTAPKTSTTSRGLVLFLTAAPDLRWTDLPTKPLMVPLMQELVLQGVGRSTGAKVALAGTSPSLPAGGTELAAITDPSAPAGEGSQTPAMVQVDPALRLGVPIRNTGLWNVRSAAGGSVGVLAFNADPQGSQMDLRSKEELAHWLTPISTDLTWLEPGSAALAGTPAAGSAGAQAALTRDSKVPPISLPLLAAALVIAVIETGLARWFSHARADAVLSKGLGSGKGGAGVGGTSSAPAASSGGTQAA